MLKPRDASACEVIFVAAKQRLCRTIMDENGGGAGQFIAASTTGDRARLT
jgi:hypothetical protein